MIELDLAPGVRRASQRDLDRLAGVLARAFREDPFHRWLLPEEDLWRRQSPRLWRALLRARRRHGGVLTSEGGEAVAVWGAPTQRRGVGLDELGFALRGAWILGRRLPRLLPGMAAVAARHPREPHWYLEVLGTDPPHRGRGLGVSLLAPVLARCDRAQLPAYLEASRPENVPYYERLGFAVCGEVDVPRGPRIHLMWRVPQSPDRGS